MKKLPESPFKETDKLAEKLLLDIADKTDKALLESLNDLIKAGILEIRILEPRPVIGEPGFWIKSGVQVVPKFDEYTKKLESENSELKKQLQFLASEQDRRIQNSVLDINYSAMLEKEILRLKETMEGLVWDRTQAEQRYEEINKELISANCNIIDMEQELEASRQASECFRNFLKLGKE